MTWFFLALSCAVFTACCDSISKRVMETNDEWITGTAVTGIAAILLMPIFLAQGPGPLTMDLLALLAVAVPLEVLAYYLFLSAIRMAPLSLALPLLAFTPVMTIITSAILLGERIYPIWACGIMLVTAGAYVLNGDLANKALIAPLKALLSHSGCRRMFVVALIWSVTSALGKKGVLMYGAVPFGAVLLICLAVCFALITICRLQATTVRLALNGKTIGLLLLAGALMAGAGLTHFVSLSQAPVACMIAVKRLSLVFGVILGWLLFQEQGIRYRLAAACIMVAGVFLIY